MAIFKCNNYVFEALSFADLIDLGRSRSTTHNIVNGMPWSFSYNSIPITHENDDLYIVGTVRFSRGAILVFDTNGDVLAMSVDEFFKWCSALSKNT